MPEGEKEPEGDNCKGGSKNRQKAAARDERRAAEEEAATAAADDVLADLATQPEAVAEPVAPSAKAAQQERRRQAILYVYEELGSPPEELWDGPGGAVAAIMQWLQLKKGADPRPVRQTLERYVAGDSLTDY